MWRDCYLHSHGTENSDLCGKHPPAEQMMLVVLINRYREGTMTASDLWDGPQRGFTRTPTTEPGNAENLDSRCFTRPTFILNCLYLWTQYQLGEAPSILATFWFLTLDICLKVQTNCQHNYFETWDVMGNFAYAGCWALASASIRDCSANIPCFLEGVMW